MKFLDKMKDKVIGHKHKVMIYHPRYNVSMKSGVHDAFQIHKIDMRNYLVSDTRDPDEIAKLMNEKSDVVFIPYREMDDFVKKHGQDYHLIVTIDEKDHSSEEEKKALLEFIKNRKLNHLELEVETYYKGTLPVFNQRTNDAIANVLGKYLSEHKNKKK